MDFGFQIVTTACQCAKSPQTCQNSVIQRREGKSSELPFLVQKLAVRTEKLSDWNLSQFSQPRHPMFNNKELLPRVKCTYLHIYFNSVDDRKEFGNKFNNALKRRDNAEKNIDSITDRTTMSWSGLSDTTSSSGLSDTPPRVFHEITEPDLFMKLHAPRHTFKTTISPSGHHVAFLSQKLLMIHCLKNDMKWAGKRPRSIYQPMIHSPDIRERSCPDGYDWNYICLSDSFILLRARAQRGRQKKV